ncbi:lysophospholipid acyltransferase family protein [Alkalilacustris brevis]|uniref:lysophospholipid acyltransferase family protein n=1 Tax=Alkalilacustris brevis TaxID=2026338 RepID=UPI001EE4B235|nr:lysophospholipid acyltransferase family protein [Alkalilacustris brevis]
MSTWRPPEGAPLPPPPTAAGWLRAGPRIVALAAVVFGGLVLMLVLRLAERPICGLRRPVTPWITVAVCKAALLILGLRLRVAGQPMRVRGALVCNHASWLDIFVLNATQPVYFVAKSEVARWPGIGWLARATGTVFIKRSGREAKLQKLIFEARLRANHRLLFFPEGTSTDGQRVLPFKSTLFAAFFEHGLRDILHVQPVSLRYSAPPGRDTRFHGWWGDMPLMPHLVAMAAAPRGGQVRLTFHTPARVADFSGRKALAAHCEAEVRAGVMAG